MTAEKRLLRTAGIDNLYFAPFYFPGLAAAYYFCFMYLYFFPFIAAGIGWLLHLTLLNYLLGKVLPQRVPYYAGKAAQQVNIDTVTNNWLKGEKGNKVVADLIPFVENHIDIFLKEKLKEKMPAIAMFIGDKTIELMKASLMEEIYSLLPEVLEKFSSLIMSTLKPEQMVQAMFEKMPEGKLEALLIQNTKKEQRFIQVFGAVSGFAIGCILVLLLKIQ